MADALSGETGSLTLALTAAALLTVGFAFKVAAVPFHMWTPDVYDPYVAASPGGQDYDPRRARRSKTEHRPEPICNGKKRRPSQLRPALLDCPL
jgi:hypothetical protein